MATHRCYVDRSSNYYFSPVQGVCENLQAGDIVISLSVETRDGTKMRVGYASDGTRLYVEELGQHSVSKGVYSLSFW